MADSFNQFDNPTRPFGFMLNIVAAIGTRIDK